MKPVTTLTLSRGSVNLILCELMKLR